MATLHIIWRVLLRFRICRLMGKTISFGIEAKKRVCCFWTLPITSKNQQHNRKSQTYFFLLKTLFFFYYITPLKYRNHIFIISISLDVYSRYFFAIQTYAATVCHFYVATFRHYIPFYCGKGAHRDKGLNIRLSVALTIVLDLFFELLPLSTMIVQFWDSFRALVRDKVSWWWKVLKYLSKIGATNKISY